MTTDGPGRCDNTDAGPKQPQEAYSRESLREVYRFPIPRQPHPRPRAQRSRRLLLRWFRDAEVLEHHSIRDWSLEHFATAELVRLLDYALDAQDLGGVDVRDMQEAREAWAAPVPGLPHPCSPKDAADTLLDELTDRDELVDCPCGGWDDDDDCPCCERLASAWLLREAVAA